MSEKGPTGGTGMLAAIVTSHPFFRVA
jgi:hypothetical protein